MKCLTMAFTWMNNYLEVLGVQPLRPLRGVLTVLKVQWVRDDLELHWFLGVLVLQPLLMDQVFLRVLDLLVHH